MNQKIYKRLAKKYGVSVEQIKRDMQDAIDVTYARPSDAAKGVARKGSIPTVDEFMNYAIGEVKGGTPKAAVVKDYDNLIDGSLKRLIMDLYTSIGGTIFKDEALLTEFRHKATDQLHVYHFGLGMYLRNNVLSADSAIYKAFKEHGITHKDDMSAAIIHIWHKALQQK